MKKRRKINIIDVVVILAVLAVAAGIVWRFAHSGADIGAGSKKITYTLKIAGVRPFTVPLYEIGDRCFDIRTEAFIGVIKNVEVYELKSTHTGLDGLPYKVVRPQAVDIYLTIEADGRETQSTYYANATYKLKIGSEVSLITKKMEVNTTIVGIEGVESSLRNDPYTGGFERP